MMHIISVGVCLLTAAIFYVNQLFLQATLMRVIYCSQNFANYLNHGMEPSPNMHMACHLKDCLLDFGPFLSFWCFPYECYNGILEGVSKSWILPEKPKVLRNATCQTVECIRR